MTRRSTFRRFSVLFLLGAAGSVGCSAGATLPSSDLASEIGAAGVTSDAAFAQTIADAPVPLTSAYGERLVRGVVTPNATTARLRMLNELVAQHFGSELGEEDYLIEGQVQTVFCVAPRDVEFTNSTPAGQTLVTLVEIDDGAAELRVEVRGTALAEYGLAFTMANHRVRIPSIPAGSTPEATARLIAAAIRADKDPIQQDFMSEVGIGPNTAVYEGSDGLSVHATGATIVVDPAWNG